MGSAVRVAKALGRSLALWPWPGVCWPNGVIAGNTLLDQLKLIIDDHQILDLQSTPDTITPPSSFEQGPALQNL